MILAPTITTIRKWEHSALDEADNKGLITYKSEFFIVEYADEIGTTGEWSIVPGTVGKLGYTDGEKLLWITRNYPVDHRSNTCFYSADAKNKPSFSNIGPVTREEWLDYVIEKTPQCMPWILFHLDEIGL